MLVPFTGLHCQDSNKDAFNYFLSQMLICIEISFGLLTNKWHILQLPMQTSLSNSSDIIMATSRLHNFVITVDSRKDASSDAILGASGSPLNWGYCPTAEKLNPIPGTSQVRYII